MFVQDNGIPWFEARAAPAGPPTGHNEFLSATPGAVEHSGFFLRATYNTGKYLLSPPQAGGGRGWNTGLLDTDGSIEPGYPPEPERRAKKGPGFEITSKPGPLLL